MDDDGIHSTTVQEPAGSSKSCNDCTDHASCASCGSGASKCQSFGAPALADKITCYIIGATWKSICGGGRGVEAPLRQTDLTTNRRCCTYRMMQHRFQGCSVLGVQGCLVTRHLCTECRPAENVAAGITPCVAHAHPANACKICSPCVPSFTFQAPAHAAHTVKVARSSKSVAAFILWACKLPVVMM